MKKYLKFFFFGFITLNFLSMVALLGYSKLELIDPLHELKDDLIEELDSANQEIEKRTAQNSELRKQNAKLYDEITDTIEELTDYEQKITDSLAWFQENQTIDNHATYNRVNKDLQDYCVNISGNTCEIKLSCLSFVNGDLHGIEYKEDTETSATDDFLQTLDEIKYNDGGDCEDFSVLAAAELRSLQTYCANNGATSYRYQAYQEAPGESHDVEYSGSYYYPDARDYDLPASYQYFYPICGNFPESLDPNAPETEEVIGHCLLAFSAVDIVDFNSNSAYPFLSTAILIEPQDGAYVTNLRTDSSLEVLRDQYPTQDYFLYMVITENDMWDFDFFGDEYRWYGYNDFLRRIDTLKQQLDSM